MPARHLARDHQEGAVEGGGAVPPLPHPGGTFTVHLCIHHSGRHLLIYLAIYLSIYSAEGVHGRLPDLVLFLTRSLF